MTDKDFTEHLLDALTDPEDGLGYVLREDPILAFADGIVAVTDFRAIVNRAVNAYDESLTDEAFDNHDRWEAGYDDGMRDGINLAIKQVEAVKP